MSESTAEGSLSSCRSLCRLCLGLRAVVVRRWPFKRCSARIVLCIVLCTDWPRTRRCLLTLLTV